MSKKIAKLSKLNNLETFAQVNLVKGYKYIDKAGEIVNHYYSDAAPDFTMGINGLVMKQPLANVEEFKITPQIMWMKLLQPDSLDLVKDIFSKEVEVISKIIEVSQITRVGWRNYFVYEFSQEDDSDKYFASLSTISSDKVKLGQLLYEFPAGDDLKAKMIIRAVEKAGDNSIKAVLYDVDIFKEDNLDTSAVLHVLKSISEYLQTDFVAFLNSTFSGAGK